MGGDITPDSMMKDGREIKMSSKLSSDVYVLIRLPVVYSSINGSREKRHQNLSLVYIHAFNVVSSHKIALDGVKSVGGFPRSKTSRSRRHNKLVKLSIARLFGKARHETKFSLTTSQITSCIFLAYRVPVGTYPKTY